jgi:hypothetical protein
MPPDKSRRKVSPAVPRPNSFERFAAALERRATLIAAALVLLATVRIVATFSVFSHTTDEPAHLVCGMEWLDRGVYQMEAQHPPLARVAAAIGPYLLGRHFHTTEILDERLFRSGMEVYNEGNDYDLTLTASRLGVLPFFWIAAAVVYLWAKRDFGVKVALAALFLFTFLPPVLAHAGLATTDMALTAFLGAAFLAGREWLERPSPKSAAIFGVCGALAVASKFSSLAYFPAAAGLALIGYFAAGLAPAGVMRAIRERLPSFGVAIGVALVIVWAAYRFSFGKVDFAPFPLPAPEFYKGIQEVIKHNNEGHLSYLFGKISPTGFQGFYFVVLAFKTPLAFLALTGVGVAVAARKVKSIAFLLPAAYAAGIVAVSFFSRINIGVRHILPIYTALAILAAVGLVNLVESAGKRRWAAAVLLGWLSLSSLLSHPDYLPYFNELAGGHPEKILVDSDLDWGQDMKRLEQRLRAGGARIATLGVLTRVNQAGLPPLRKVNQETPLVGWTAIGFTAWKEYRLGLKEDQPGKILWPERYPPHEIVGKSIALWYFPPSSGLPLE